MKKPKKKDCLRSKCIECPHYYKHTCGIIEYNIACDDWKRFLPDAEEIEKIITKVGLGTDLQLPKSCNCALCERIRKLARTIAKRIGKEG